MRESKHAEKYDERVVRLLSFIVTTKSDVLCLEIDESETLTWCAHASFSMCADMRSHAGSIFTLGKWSITTSTQKRSARGSVESEINGLDDKTSKIMWNIMFIVHPSWDMKHNIILQDSTSTIKLLKNG